MAHALAIGATCSRRVAVAGADWLVLGAASGTPLLGSVLQWAQSAVQARRERKREQQGWSREDRRLWAEKRQAIYLETIASARRQLMSAEGMPWVFSNLVGAGPAPARPPITPELLIAVKAGKPPGTRPKACKRTPEVRADWNRLLTEIEFYGSDEVRAAVAQLELAFDMLEEFAAVDPTSPRPARTSSRTRTWTASR